MAIPANIFLLFALFLVQLHLAFGFIPLNETLSNNDQNASWLSSSRDFAFGFRPINNNRNLFLLAIWFAQIQNQTIVWHADIKAPIPIGSTVQLTTRGLSLTNPQGQAIYMWPTGLQEDVSFAEMRDDGNFVLASSTSFLWQSFNNPTDTLLPNQTLDINSTLSSRLTETNYTKGRFELYFNSGRPMLSQVGWPTESRYTPYYKFDVNLNASVLGLVFDSSGNVYAGQRLVWDGLDLDVTRYYYRATLDYYGVFTLYSHPREFNDNQVWLIVNRVPQNICTEDFGDLGSGCCGYNSYCLMEDQMPTCKCLDGYSLVDSNNLFGGCQPAFSLGCGADDIESKTNLEEVYEMKTVPNLNWLGGDYERLDNSNDAGCKKSCLNDCNCAVAIFNNAYTCWKKRLPLSNGRSLANADGTLALIKIRKKSAGIISPAPEKEDRVQPALLGSLIGSLIINTLLVATVVLGILLKPKRIVVQVSGFVEANMHSFTYEALKEATHGFSEEVGRGSFGIVYKGTLNSINNSAIVAVKRLDRMAQEREKEFSNELSSIGKTCHKNLVRLIGFCDQGVHRLLVYEFMSNGTLADILFRKPKPIWDLRVRFALGIARGLLYLHEECETPIIHCDIKPQNILIDEHFMPKISDFGLAKLLYSNKSRTLTMIRGTRGYVAPEWFKNSAVTAKVDVYSYGVMLLEIICCRRSLEKDMDEVEEHEAILTDLAYDCYMEGRIDILVDNDKEAIADIGRVKKWVRIAIWCIQEKPETRPSMKTVMQMLEGLVEVPNPPLPSSFFTSSMI